MTETAAGKVSTTEPRPVVSQPASVPERADTEQTTTEQAVRADEAGNPTGPPVGGTSGTADGPELAAKKPRPRRTAPMASERATDEPAAARNATAEPVTSAATDPDPAARGAASEGQPPAETVTPTPTVKKTARKAARETSARSARAVDTALPDGTATPEAPRTAEEPATPEAQRTAEEPATPEAQRTAEEPATPEAQRTAEEPATPEAQRTVVEPPAHHGRHTAKEPTTPEAQRTAEEPATHQARHTAEEPAEDAVTPEAADSADAPQATTPDVTGTPDLPATPELAATPAATDGTTTTAATTTAATTVPAGTAGTRVTAASAAAAVWSAVRTRPGYAVELAVSQAADQLAPLVRDEYERMRAAYPDATPDGLARLATTRAVRQARIGGAVAGLAGAGGMLAGTGALGWTHVRLALEIAAGFGLDPGGAERVPELLVLLKVHPDLESARTAVAAAGRGDARPGPDPLRWATVAVRVVGPALAARRLGRLVPGGAALVSAVTAARVTERFAARAVRRYRAVSDRDR